MVRSTSALGYSINVKVLANIILALFTITSALLALIYHSKTATYTSIILSVPSAMGTTVLVIYEEYRKSSRNEMRLQTPLLVATIPVHASGLYQQGNPSIGLNLPLYIGEQLQDMRVAGPTTSVQASFPLTMQWLQSRFSEGVQILWGSDSAQNRASRHEE